MNKNIEKLIEIAVNSEAITERQREIIRNKAIALGEDPEEAEMILDLTIKKKKRKDSELEEEDVQYLQEENQIIIMEQTRDIVRTESSPISSSINSIGSTVSRTTDNAVGYLNNVISNVSFDSAFAPVSGTSKSKLIAAILAFFLGLFGAHKFYLGDTKNGILYLLFCWTGIPMMIGWVEGIMYLLQSDEKFRSRIQ